MKRFLLIFGWLLFLFHPLARAQTFPTLDYFHNLTHQPQIPTQLPVPEGLRDYLVAGKLRLGLTDAIRLTLLNNTEVRLNQLQYEETRFAIQRAYQPFDPLFNSGFNTRRSTLPTFTQLQGAPTLTDLSHHAQIGYAQTLQTGTQYNIS